MQRTIAARSITSPRPPIFTCEVGEKSFDGKDVPWPNDRRKKKYYIVDMGTFEVVLRAEGELTVHAVTFRNTK